MAALQNVATLVSSHKYNRTLIRVWSDYEPYRSYAFFQQLDEMQDIVGRTFASCIYM